MALPVVYVGTRAAVNVEASSDALVGGRTGGSSFHFNLPSRSKGEGGFVIFIISHWICVRRAVLEGRNKRKGTILVEDWARGGGGRRENPPLGKVGHVAIFKVKIGWA